jgi:hypothetical protein
MLELVISGRSVAISSLDFGQPSAIAAEAGSSDAIVATRIHKRIAIAP